jgi:hypothetical protein
LASDVQELVWASDFMAEIGFEQTVIRLLEENQSTVLQASGEYKSGKSDHYRSVKLYTEDFIHRGLILVGKVPTDHIIIGNATKQAGPIGKFERHRDIADVKNPSVY